MNSEEVTEQDRKMGEAGTKEAIQEAATELRRLEEETNKLHGVLAKIRELVELEKQRSKELQDFEISKIYAAFFEASKLSSTSLTTYIFLLAVTTLLIFSKGIEGNITIPLLPITTSKNYAAAVSLALSCCILFWHYSTYLHTAAIGFALKIKLKQRYGMNNIAVSLYEYPSPLSSSVMTAGFLVFAITQYYELFFVFFMPVIVCFYFVPPLLLAWYLSSLMQHTPFIFWGTAVLLLPSAAAQVSLFYLQWTQVEKQIKKLWQEWKEELEQGENL
jgi:hypothetical protein